MYILILNRERAERQETEGEVVATRGGDGRKSTWGENRVRWCVERRKPETNPSGTRNLVPERKEEGFGCPPSTIVSHLRRVPIVVRLSIRCRQLVHEVHPDLLVTPRPMHRQCSDLTGSIILLVISVMWIHHVLLL